MTTKPKLRSVPEAAPVSEPAPSLDYEWQQRQASARKDWAALHIRSDRSRPLEFVRYIVRGWR